MKILHYYASNEVTLVTQYVKTLCEAMDAEVSNEVTTNGTDAKERLTSSHYDILHIHGCWQYAAYRVACVAWRENTRVVITPHGELEPWVVKQHYWKEKLPKRLLFMKRLIERAYAVIIQGKMEEECMKKLGWNSRTVIIRNSIITHSISPKEMAQQVAHIYRKVLDSNTLELMTDDTKDVLRQLIKVGITGDERWLQEERKEIHEHAQWRMLYCYIHHEQVVEVVKRGLRILRMDAPYFDIQQMPCFMPDGYEPAKSIESAIGMQYATENDRLMATFRHLKRLAIHHRLTISHLVELDKELRQHDSAEDQLCNALQERNLYVFAGRVMQLMHDLTGLDEGMMPMPAVNDRQTRQLRKHIDNHLKI